MNSLLFITAFFLGVLHSFDPDHIVVMTVFSSKNTSLRGAVMQGVKWGYGHSIMLFIVGMSVSVLHLNFSSAFEDFAEFIVGLILIGTGLWAMKDILSIMNIHMHHHTHNEHQHVHFHSHSKSNNYRHNHATLFVGAFQGIAGTSSILLLIPITMISSPIVVGTFILIFSLGIIISMVIYTVCVNFFCNRVLKNTHGLRLSVMAVSGLCSVVIGLLWIVKNPVFILR